MPVIAKDEKGSQIKHAILGGRAQVLMFAGRDSWYYRQLKKGARSSRQTKGSPYITRCLEEIELTRAILKGEELYFALEKQIDANGKPIQRHSITDLLKEWIRINEDRQRAGQLSGSSVKAKVSSLQNATLIYLTQYKKLKTIDEIQVDTFADFSKWRIDESWKSIKSSKGHVVPLTSTVKRDLVHIKDWFQNFLYPRSYVTQIPSFEKLVVHADTLDKNPPIPLNPDWGHIHRYLDDWVKEAEANKNGNTQRIQYWRQLFRHLCLVLYNSGCRPSELLGKVERIKDNRPNGTFGIKTVLKGGLRWEDVEVETAIHKSESGKQFEIPIATLHIRYSKTGVPREVPCNTGQYFIRWRAYCDKWRDRNGLQPLTKKDYVFFNPNNNNPYPYSQVHKAWVELRDNLSLLLSPIRSDQKYTLYSLRSSYITNQIEEGKDIYLIKKITGHSLEVLQRHYDRSDVKKRKAEATQRTYGRKQKKDNYIDLDNLDESHY